MPEDLQAVSAGAGERAIVLGVVTTFQVPLLRATPTGLTLFREKEAKSGRGTGWDRGVTRGGRREGCVGMGNTSMQGKVRGRGEHE